MNSNLIKTVDKNGNVLKNTYDYQNRLTAMKNQTHNEVISEYKSEYLLNRQKSKEHSNVTDEDGKKSPKTATYTKEEFKKNKKKASIEELVYTFNSHYEKSGDDKEFIKIKRVQPAIDYYKTKTFRGEYNG